MKRFTVIIWAFLVAAPVLAQEPAAFSRVGFGVRGLGMGNALAADAFNGASPYYNPALAPFAEAQNLEAAVAALTFDRSIQFLQLATPLEDRAGIAAGLIHGAVSNIDGRDNSGFHTRDLSVDEYMAFLAFGLRLGERVSGGVSLQLFRSDLFEGLDPATTIGIDLGMTVGITENVRVALVIDDLLARYDWDTNAVFGDGRQNTDQFPRRIRLAGAGLFQDGKLLVTGEIESRTASVERRFRTSRLLGDSPVQFDDSESLTLHAFRIRAGAEYRLMDMLAVRAGFDRTVGAIRPSTGFSVDQPVGNLMVRVGYAVWLEPNGTGTAHVGSLRLNL